jgi:hypothetical protein
MRIEINIATFTARSPGAGRILGGVVGAIRCGEPRAVLPLAGAPGALPDRGHSSGLREVVKNGLHLDVRVGAGLVGEERLATLEAESARLVALGAVRVDFALIDHLDSSSGPPGRPMAISQISPTREAIP